MEAVIAAGATLSEIYRWVSGKYPGWFKAWIVAWYQLHSLVKQHEQDALNKAEQKKARKK